MNIQISVHTSLHTFQSTFLVHVSVQQTSTIVCNVLPSYMYNADVCIWQLQLHRLHTYTDIQAYIYTTHTLSMYICSAIYAIAIHIHFSSLYCRMYHISYMSICIVISVALLPATMYTLYVLAYMYNAACALQVRHIHRVYMHTHMHI